MKFLFLIVIVFFSSFSYGANLKSNIRVAFINEDFGNWHFCGDEQSHKPICEPGDAVKGFNPEIAKEVFKRIGKPYDVVFAEWAGDTFFEGLVDDKYDVIISNIAQKDSRKKYGIFSKLPYEPLDEIGDYLFYTLKESEVTLSSIGTQTGTIQESYLKNLFKPEVIKSYSSTQDLVNSLINGDSNAIFGSFSIMKNLICAEPNIIQFSSVSISLDQAGVDDRTYILTTKRMDGLAKEIDRVLQVMHSDGTIQTLFDKWLKKSFECPIKN